MGDFNFCYIGTANGHHPQLQFINTTDPLVWLFGVFLWPMFIPIIDIMPFRYLRGKYIYRDSRENYQTGESECVEDEFILSPSTYLKKLAEIAKAYGCQIIVFWPMNERNNKRKEKRPKLSDFRYSKAINEYADGIYVVQHNKENSK